jgi:hypothetical protein
VSYYKLMDKEFLINCYTMMSNLVEVFDAPFIHFSAENLVRHSRAGLFKENML